MPDPTAPAAPPATPPAAPKSDGGKADAPPPAETIALTVAEVAELRAARDAHAKLLADVEADRRKAKEHAAAQAKDAEAKGELAKALELERARVAELAPLEDDAKAWRAHVAAETKRLDETAAKLPEVFQDLYKSAGNLEAKRKVIAAYEATTIPEARVPKTPPGSTPPAGKGVDFSTISDPSTLRAAKAADPAGWSAFKARLTSSSGPETTHARRAAARAKSVNA